MWLELSQMWLNTDHLVRVEFTEKVVGKTPEGNAVIELNASLTTTKHPGSDRTFLVAEDAVILKNYLVSTKPVKVDAFVADVKDVVPFKKTVKKPVKKTNPKLKTASK